ncbi:putative piggybac transposable element-derived [Nephila pilipes]|uniref:Putative piggybac transposable element-derived n=1 Tax=Nephila pilipes TaxID=299642 RepID=A0A8X6PD41_NEPPI|nr:putative piggybac transposable element-derived [Nephila pilipes]
MSRKKVFKIAKEAVEYLFSEELDSEMIVLPPEVDELTDEKGFDDTETLDPSTSRGTHDFYFDVKNIITAVKWNDNKCVTLATNFDIIEPLTSVSRCEKGKTEKKNKIEQPCLVNNYNKIMGGVDSHDWLLEKHTIRIRGKNWYWPNITRIVDMAVVNNAGIRGLLVMGDENDTMPVAQQNKMMSQCEAGIQSMYISESSQDINIDMYDGSLTGARARYGYAAPYKAGEG